MKLSIYFLAGSTTAHHYRGIHFGITQKSEDRVTIHRTFAWRRGALMDGFNECTRDHITQQAQSKLLATIGINAEECKLLSGGFCEQDQLESRYIITDLEDQEENDHNYCYGSQEVDFAKTAGPFKIEWDGANWINDLSERSQI